MSLGLRPVSSGGAFSNDNDAKLVHEFAKSLVSQIKNQQGSEDEGRGEFISLVVAGNARSFTSQGRETAAQNSQSTTSHVIQTAQAAVLSMNDVVGEAQQQTELSSSADALNVDATKQTTLNSVNFVL